MLDILAISWIHHKLWWKWDLEVCLLSELLTRYVNYGRLLELRYVDFEVAHLGIILLYEGGAYGCRGVALGYGLKRFMGFLGRGWVSYV